MGNNQLVSVIGAGSWGTAIADLLAEAGNKVDLWVYEEELYHDIREKRENTLYMPGYLLSENINPVLDLKAAAEGKRILVLVVPSHIIRGIVPRISPYIDDDTLIVSASKGIENDTLLTISQILRSLLPVKNKDNVAVLSGPTFAKELIRKKATAVTIASESEEAIKVLHPLFSTSYFKVFTCSDIIGVELGGALKNVLAIASGICDGLDLGHNTRAALITRGLAEMVRLGEVMGANPRTFAGLSGIGDLVLTCTGDLSRNRTLGKRLGKGEKVKDILESMKMVAEGVKTVKSVYQLSKKYNVSLSIMEEVYHIIYNNKDIRDAFRDLMNRETNYEY